MRAVEGDLEDEGSGIRGLARGGLLDAPGIPGAAPEALAGFAAVLPEWGERFRTGSSALALEQARAFPAIVSAATGEGPLLLAMDDAQWADRASLLGLLALLRDLPAVPLCMVFATTSHPPRDELDELRRRLDTGGLGIALSLGPLDGDALRQLAHWALPAYDPAALDRVARRVASDSAGIPFLAVELLSAVAQGLDLKVGSAAWPAPSRTLTQSLPSDLPDTVVAAIRIGFRRLGEDARQVLAAAAVLGGRSTEAQLTRATALASARVEAALDELEWQRSEEHTSELQSRLHLVCRLLLEKKKDTANFREGAHGIGVVFCEGVLDQHHGVSADQAHQQGVQFCGATPGDALVDVVTAGAVEL